MKKNIKVTLALAALAILVVAASPVTMIRVVIDNPNVAEQVGTNGYEYATMTFIASKARGATNTGAVYVQFASATNSEAVKLEVGETFTLTSSSSRDRIRDSDVWLTADTTNDAVNVILIR